MARPKGSLNKAPQAKLMQKKPTKVICTGEDLEKVNKMLSSFVESVEEETKNRQEEPQEKVPREEGEPQEDILVESVESLGDFMRRITAEVEAKLTPEKKIELLERKVKALEEALDEHRVVISYLEEKLGIEE